MQPAPRHTRPWHPQRSVSLHLAQIRRSRMRQLLPRLRLLLLHLLLVRCSALP